MTLALDGSLVPQLFNVAVAGLLGIIGYIMRSWREELKVTQSKIYDLELSVSKEYLPRSEHDKFAARLFDTLARIEDKIDNKMDKR